MSQVIDTGAAIGITPRARTGSMDAAAQEAVAALATATGSDHLQTPAVDAEYRFTGEGATGISFERRWTTPGVHPYDEVEWEMRTASISSESGKTVFEQTDVEVPAFWSQLATNVVVSKYFRGHIGTPQREHSVRQLIDRVVNTITAWAATQRYFATDEDMAAFKAELTHLLLHQKMAFNSPVWFNVGVEERPQCSACQPYHALVSTPDGMVPIGELVEQTAIGREVYDASGITRIVAVKANGLKPVHRVRLRNGSFVEATPDHVVRAVRGRRSQAEWLRVDELAVGMRMHLYPHRAKVAARTLAAVGAAVGAAEAPAPSVGGSLAAFQPLDETARVACAEAALAGWLQADGFVGQYTHGTNRSLTIEFQVANDDEHAWVMENLDIALPGLHRKERVADTKETFVRRIRLYGEALRDFVERWQLLDRGVDIRVPARLWTASYDEITAYLRSLFQADGYVTLRRGAHDESGRVGFAVISERWTEDVQLLLNSIGIYSRRTRKVEERDDRHDLYEVAISIGSERARFAELVGFVGHSKQARLLESLKLRGLTTCPSLREEEIVAIEQVGVQEVYDIQTESGEYLSNNIAVHNCFINSVQDSMSSIMDLAKTEAMLFKYGSGAGVNLSTIRGSKEKMSGGGIASGPVSFMKGFDAFAGVVKCLTSDTYIVTTDGLLRIEEAIPTAGPEGFEESAALTLNTPAGPQAISQVYRSPLAPVRTMTLRSGLTLRGTREHPVLTLNKDFRLEWAALSDVRPGTRVAVERHRELWPERAPSLAEFRETYTHAKRKLGYPSEVTPELARLLGYLVAEGALDDERFRFTSADPEIMVDFCRCVEAVFGIDPSAQVTARCHPVTGVITQQVSLSWKGALQFLEFCGLPPVLSDQKAVPAAIRRSPRSLVLEFLGAYAEGDGHVGSRSIEFASASSWLLEEVQLLCLNMGVVGRRSTINGYGRLAFMGEDGSRLARLLHPYLITPRKRSAAAALAWTPATKRNTNLDVIPGLVRALRSLFSTANGWARTSTGEAVRTGFGLFNRASDNVSYARALATPGLVDTVRKLSPGLGETLGAVLADGFLWDEVASIQDDGRALTYDFTVPGVHAFVSNGIVSHNSGGKTRRAAKMVILDADHPDVMEFVDSKANEERKAWALIEAGYDPSFTGEAYGSVFFQNANHSVRVTDEFMEAIGSGADWTTHEVTTGDPVDTMPAKSVFRRMSEAAWLCGDPGIQYDTTINDWNPVSSSARQYATNPCSEFSFINDTSCNLASLNLLKFVDPDGEFDIDAFKHAVRVTITAQEMMVDNASYPTPQIEENSHRFRPLGIGYANLGALLMSRGLAYDSPEGQSYAATITAIMTGEAYRQSAVVARDHGGPFNDYAVNERPFLRVIEKHRDAAHRIADDSAPQPLVDAARSTWDQTLEFGRLHGYRNAQVSVLAPTGCLVGDSLVLSDRGLVRLRGLGNPDGAKWQDLDLRVGTDDGSRDATKFFVNGAEPVVKVTTRRGYQIQGTTMHRIKVVDADGAWQWRRFSDLREGDRVPLMLGGMVGEPRLVELPPLAEAYWTSDHTTFVPRKVTADLAELVGYFMGDGSLHSKGLRLCVDSKDLDVVDRIADLGRRLFGLKAAVSTKRGYTEVALHSVRLALWWEACGFAKHAPTTTHRGKGYEAHIPDAILYANDPAVYRAFVRGLFEADGNASNGYAYWTTISERFSHDVQTLLLALGFVTTRKIDQPIPGHLGNNPLQILRLLNAAEGGRFIHEISFISERKRNALQLVVHQQSARYDYIPVSRATVDRLAPTNDHLRKTMLLSLARTGMVSRRSATTLLERTADPNLASTLGYFYDEVASATLGSEQLTYDISVPSNVTYVANGFVSHNTIAFMMDCDTTGVEPDIALIKYKKLVGEGFLKIVNNTVPAALRRLGYTADEADAIVEYIDQHETIEGAPELKPEHLPVFDCAFKPVNGERSIHYMGHVRMMGAVQPFLSGAISKTVNMPEAATAEDIEDVYLQGWKLGLKAIAIYRDGSKRSQPLSTGKKKDSDTAAESQAAVAAASAVLGFTGEPKPYRRRLPSERTAVTHKFQVAGHEGYITVGLYEDGTPGELFLKMAKEGSTISGLMDTIATMTSVSLQYGVPLRDLVNKFAHVRFEPAGFTGNPEIPIAKSIVDYVFRWMGSRFLSAADRETLGLISQDAQQMTMPFAAPAATSTPTPPEAAAPLAVSASASVDTASADLMSTTEPTLASIPAAAGTSSPAAASPLPVPMGAGNGNGHNGNGNGSGTGLSPFTASLGAATKVSFSVSADSPSCADCGSIMVRNGSCYKCLNCGSTSGCS